MAGPPCRDAGSHVKVSGLHHGTPKPSSQPRLRMTEITKAKGDTRTGPRSMGRVHNAPHNDPRLALNARGGKQEDAVGSDLRQQPGCSAMIG